MIKSKDVSSDCFANQKFLLNCFGMVYNQNVLHKVFSIGSLILLTIYLFSVFPEVLKEYYVDLKKFVYSAMFAIALLVCLICAYFSLWNGFHFKQLFEKLQLLDELSNFKNSEGENVFVEQYKDIVRKQACFGLALITIVDILFVSMSIIISLNEEKWILPFGSGSAIINNDIIQFIIQIITFSKLAIGFYLLLVIYINVLTLICCHCKLLQKYIALSFTDYHGKIYKELDVKRIKSKIPDWESFKLQLQNIVPYHIAVIDVSNQIEAAFSLMIFVVFGGLSICMCLLIYHTQLNIDMMEIAQDALMLMIGYSILIIVSSYGEKILTESANIASICYELDFVNSDLRIQKSLIIIMARSQRPITLTIGKLKVLGFRTMLSILQSIYSYYTILRNVMNE